jgi:cbb3-type cytochrome oxidase maturation protein
MSELSFTFFPSIFHLFPFYMAVIMVLIIFSILVAGSFLAGFIWAVRSGQYEDTDSPAVRILLDDKK